MRFHHFLLCLALSMSATAEAAYVRIWRGHQKAGLSDREFFNGLNHALLPATGELALGPAGLKSYLPVALPPELKARGLPAEVALLTYENEADYRAFRATAEGIHYGDLHWDLFDRATSASLVPAAYEGVPAFERAYRIVDGDPTWATGTASFHVFERLGTESDEGFLARVAGRITAVKASAPLAYYVVVSQTYAFEYLNTTKGADHHSASGGFATPLRRSRTLTAGAGIRYPVTEDLADAGVRDLWTRHINAWNARDLDRIMLDYEESSVVIRNDEVYRGLTAIRSLFADLFARFAHVTEGSVDRVIHVNGVTYITWRARAKLSDGSEILSHQGTDTFVVADGRISTQTITAAPEFWAFAP